MKVLSCNKNPFYTYKEAGLEAAKQTIRNQRRPTEKERKVCRAYRCSLCQRWHITSADLEAWLEPT